MSAEFGDTAARRHVPALDGIRGLAALLVVCFHFGRPEFAGGPATQVIGFFTQFGWAGVDLFFVLSGFLIGGILLDTRERPRFLRTFYKRRTLRIFPLYFAFVALYVLVIVPHLPGPISDIGSRQKWLWTYLTNFDIARHGWYSGVGSNANALWSLAIEEQFYLIAPLAVLLLSPRSVMLMAITCALGSIAARVALAQAAFPWTAGYVLTYARLDALSLGVILALVARRGNTLERIAPVARVVLPVTIAIALSLALSRGRFDYDDWITLELGLPALAVGFAALLVLTVSPAGSPSLRRLFESRALRFFGVYSYSLYIWHPLVGRLIRLAGFKQTTVESALGSGGAALLLTTAVKIAAATLVAIVSYHLIERPFLKLKDPPLRSAVIPVVTAAEPVLHT